MKVELTLKELEIIKISLDAMQETYEFTRGFGIKDDGSAESFVEKLSGKITDVIKSKNI